MKQLLTLCALFLLASLVGKDLLPVIFNNIYVSWSIKLGLVALLAIGFAKAQSTYFKESPKTLKSFSNSAWFLLLFLLELILPITVHYAMDSINTFELTIDRRMPINDTSSPETEDSRKFLAGFLFDEYGIKIPYELESGDFVIYEPTKEHIVKYQSKIDNQKETIELKLQLSSLARSSLHLAVIQALMFFTIFVGTVFYQQKTEK